MHQYQNAQVANTFDMGSLYGANNFQQQGFYQHPPQQQQPPMMNTHLQQQQQQQLQQQNQQFQNFDYYHNPNMNYSNFNSNGSKKWLLGDDNPVSPLEFEFHDL